MGLSPNAPQGCPTNGFDVHRLTCRIDGHSMFPNFCSLAKNNHPDSEINRRLVASSTSDENSFPGCDSFVNWISKLTHSRWIMTLCHVSPHLNGPMVVWQGAPKVPVEEMESSWNVFFSIHPDTVHLHCDWKGLGDSRFWLLYRFLWRALCLHLCISGRYITWRWVFPETMRWRRSRRGWAVGWARAQPIRFWIGIFLMRPKGPKEGLRKGHNRGHVILVSECSL